MSYKVINVEKKVDIIEVDNGLNLKMRFSNYGAGVVSLYYDDDPMILEFKDFKDYMHSSGYHGKTLGVVAGRIPCEGTLDGVKYCVTETSKGCGINLHGNALESISFRPWKYKIYDRKDSIDVAFTVKTKENEGGFPGNVFIKTIYSVSKKDNGFKIKFKAHTENKTLCNLSNHIYWNFGRSLNLSDYRLKMNCSEYGVVREDLLIVRKDPIIECLDFRKSRKLNVPLNYIEKNLFVGTIDHTFIFNKGEKPKVTLSNDKYELVLKTNLPAMNIYLDNSKAPFNFINRDDFDMRRAIALEPQKFNLDLDSIALRKGDKFDYVIDYKIKRK